MRYALICGVFVFWPLFRGRPIVEVNPLPAPVVVRTVAPAGEPVPRAPGYEGPIQQPAAVVTERLVYPSAVGPRVRVSGPFRRTWVQVD